MNRAERRKGRWEKLDPHCDYDTMVSHVGPDGAKEMVVMLRGLTGGKLSDMDDSILWNSIRNLINGGLLNVYFRLSNGYVYIKPEFLIPGSNDNAPTRKTS